jgi:hypothetical protein
MAQTNFDFVIIDMPKTIVAWTETVCQPRTMSTLPRWSLISARLKT